MPGTKHELSHSVLDCLYLCSHSKWHRQYTIDEFKRYFLYPILHDKIRIFHEDGKPVGLVTWCFLPEDIGEEFFSGLYELEEEDYLATDGEELWGVEFLAPFGHARTVMRKMREYCRENKGPNEIAHWRRLGRPDIKHKGVM